MFNYCNHDYDSWVNGWYSAARERDPQEEPSKELSKKSESTYEEMQETFVEIVKMIHDKGRDPNQLRDYIEWLAEELNVDKTLFNLGLL